MYKHTLPLRSSVVFLVLLLLLAAAFVWAGSRGLAWIDTRATTLPVSPPASTTTQPKGAPLAGLLNADGSLNLQANTHGSFDVTGYRMELGANGAPRFVAAPTTNCWDTQFTLPNGTSGQVQAIVTMGADIYVGGSFTAVGSLVANNVAKYNTSTNTWSLLGSGGGNGVNSTVVALAISGSDLYVGGFFNTANVGGTTIAANHVAKYNTSTNTWSVLGSGGGNGVFSPVYALAISGSDLYVGGQFGTANVGGATVAVNSVAKYNTSTNTWSALGTGSGNGVNGIVFAFAISGSDLYVGGSFSTANIGGATVATNNVAKYNTSTNTWSVLGSGGGNGVSGEIYALAISGSDLYVGGYFGSANVGGTTVAANNVAKYNTSTNMWSALGTGGGNGVSLAVFAFAISGSDLYVGGRFPTGGNLGANRVAKYNTSTNTWSVLGSGGGNGVNSTVVALAISGSDLYVGGYFGSANVGGTTVAANNVAKYNTSTNTWSALGTGGGNGVSGEVYALAISGSDLYVGGAFTAVGSLAANGVAKYNTSTNTWSALGSGGGNGVNNTALALAISGSDLYVGGEFGTANVGGTTVVANRVAKYNTSTNTWSALGSGGGNGVGSGVLALAISGSDLYVGGYFGSANVGGTTVAANNVAKYNTSTNTWSALGSGGGNGVGSGVLALAISGSDLYVGGTFSTANVGGTAVAANKVAKYNTSINTWSALGSGGGIGVNGEVHALAISGSDLYVGGFFSTANVGGTAVAVNSVAKYNTSTNTWSALGSGGGNGVNLRVNALAISGSDLYVGGSFSSANMGGTAVAANKVAKYNTSTNTWSALGTGGGNGVNGTVYSLALNGSDLYAGGFFGSAGGNTSANIARFLGNVTPTAPTITTLSLTRTQGTAPGNTLIANINDPEDDEADLVVTINGNASATVNGVTISNLMVSATGEVTANVATTCAASTASFEMRVTDCCGHAALATLTVTVTPNSPPTMGTYAAASVNVGAATTITPSAAPMDNGTITTVAVTAPTLTGTINVTAATGVVNVTNASPAGDHLVTIKATDNCGAMSTQTFTLRVLGAPPTINAGAPLVRQQGSPGTVSPVATVAATSVPAGNLMVTATSIPTGLSITGITNTNGNITANISAACTAAVGLNTIGLTVSDGNGGMATTNLTVNVPANTAPTLAYTGAHSVALGGMATINPAAGASDNGTVSVAVLDAGNYTGNIAVNAAGVVSLSNAAPLGTHTITLRATDNCGSVTDAILTLTVARIVASISDPIVCTGENMTLSVHAEVTNPNNAPQGFTFNAPLNPPLSGIPGSCVASGGNCTITNGNVNVTGMLHPNQTITIDYKVLVANGTPPGTNLCITSTVTFAGGANANVTACNALNCPGANPRAGAAKSGSVLVFPYYTSNAAARTDTRLQLSNVSNAAAIVHLFFIDGSSCQPSDFFACLTPNASVAFKASDYDPEVTGSVLAVAVNAQGQPIQQNALLGNAFVNEGAYVGNYAAASFAAHSAAVAASHPNGTATLFFDGSSYDAVPSQFAVEVQSPVNAPGQRVVTAGLKGDLNASQMTGAGQIGTGLLINGNETPIGSFVAFLNGNCQAIATITATNPRVPNGVTNVLRGGGTMTFNVGGAVGLLMTPRGTQWSGIRGLHQTAVTATTITIPVFAPVC